MADGFHDEWPFEFLFQSRPVPAPVLLGGDPGDEDDGAGADCHCTLLPSECGTFFEYVEPCRRCRHELWRQLHAML